MPEHIIQWWCSCGASGEIGGKDQQEAQKKFEPVREEHKGSRGGHHHEFRWTEKER